jgi:very-short-patch-repair endonuclease
MRTTRAHFLGSIAVMASARQDARRVLVADQPKLDMEILDRKVAWLAGRQHGVVGRWQLEEIGLSRQMIKTRIAHGGLNRLHRGVYAVGHRATTVESRWMAAVLAHGPHAVLSHRSAGQLWGLHPRSRIEPEVTCPGSKKTKKGIVAHRGTLLRDEVVWVRGIPVTSVPRTMFDLAATRSEREVERAWNEMEVRGFRDRLSVPLLLERYPSRKGSLVLARLAKRKELPVGITRNDLEEAFLALIDRFALPRPRMNAHLAVRERFYEIDCLWEDRRVAIELDGGAVHKTTKAFHDDRERDRILTAEGFTTARMTWDHIHDTPQEVAADLQRIVTPYPSPNGSGALRPLPSR